MTLIFGFSFNNNVPLYRALLSIPGIGHAYAMFLSRTLNFGPEATIGQVSREQLKTLNRTVLQQRIVGTALEREVRTNISKKMQFRTYQGFRHLEALPVRGQNTKTNARTAKKSNKKFK